MKNIEIKNKKAYFNYNILEELECGISLRGNEVKSIRSGMCSIKEAWCTIQNGELVIKQMHITQWETANRYDVDENRDRVLLAHKSEINKMSGQLKEKGIALVPLKLYIKSGKVKILVGVCRGKKFYDKREIIKQRDINREIQRELKNY